MGEIMGLGIWIVLGIVGLALLISIVLYNKLVAVRNQTQNAWRQIDVQLKRRHDLIPNLVEVVKDVRPTFSHHFLAELEKAGSLTAVITHLREKVVTPR